MSNKSFRPDHFYLCFVSFWSFFGPTVLFIFLPNIFLKKCLYNKINYIIIIIYYTPESASVSSIVLRCCLMTSFSPTCPTHSNSSWHRCYEDRHVSQHHSLLPMILTDLIFPPSLPSPPLSPPPPPPSLLPRCKVCRPPLLSSSPSSLPRPLLPRSLLRPSRSRTPLLRPSLLRPIHLRPPFLRPPLLHPPLARAPHIRPPHPRPSSPRPLEPQSSRELRKSALHVGPGGGIVLYTLGIHWYSGWVQTGLHLMKWPVSVR